MDAEVTSTDSTGVGQAPRAAAEPDRTRRWPGTMGTLLLTPLAVAGCGWLAQRQGTVVLVLAVVLLMIVLCTAWAMCGAGPGACVAVCGFALMMFIGPALNDYVLDQRGVRHEAAVAYAENYHNRHGDGFTCKVIRTDIRKSRVYTVGESSDCGKHTKTGDQVTLVEDPNGWLSPRLGAEANGLSSGMAGTCAGLFAAMEAFILYGRLRRRRD